MLTAALIGFAAGFGLCACTVGIAHIRASRRYETLVTNVRREVAATIAIGRAP